MTESTPKTLHVVYTDEDGDVRHRDFHLAGERGNEFAVSGIVSPLGDVEPASEFIRSEREFLSFIDPERIAADPDPGEAFAEFRARAECEISECEYRIESLRRQIEQAEELRRKVEERR